MAGRVLRIRSPGAIIARMTAMRSIAFLLSLSLSLAACAKARPEPGSHEAAEAHKDAFGTLTIDDLETRMSDAKAGKGKLAIFDNNNQERFAQGHIPGAHWVDFKNVTASDLPSDKDTALVFYCSNEH
jgi:Rhodanese-like domain